MSNMDRSSRWAHLNASGRTDAADWSGDPGDLNVFVPGLMGAGILLSAVILVSDGVRKLLPSRGVRRRLKVVRGVRRIVVDMAQAAGMSIEERNLVRRERRSPIVYVLVTAMLLPLAYLAGRWGFNAYSSTGSALEGNAMAIFYGMVGALAVGLPGLVAAILSIPHLEAPRPLQKLIQRTPFGRLAGPPESISERARLLIPSLDKGARS